MFGLNICVKNIVLKQSTDTIQPHNSNSSKILKLRLLIQDIGLIEINQSIDCDDSNTLKSRSKAFSIIQENDDFFKELIIDSQSGLNAQVYVVEIGDFESDHTDIINAKEWIERSFTILFNRSNLSSDDTSGIPYSKVAEATTTIYIEGGNTMVEHISLHFGIFDTNSRLLRGPIHSVVAESDLNQPSFPIDTAKRVIGDSFDNDEFILRLMRKCDLKDDSMTLSQPSNNAEDDVSVSDILLEYFEKINEVRSRNAAILNEMKEPSNQTADIVSPLNESKQVESAVLKPRKLRKSTVLPSVLRSSNDLDNTRTRTFINTPNATLRKATKTSQVNFVAARRTSGVINPQHHADVVRKYSKPWLLKDQAHFPKDFSLPKHSSIKVLVGKEELKMLNIEIEAQSVVDRAGNLKSVTVDSTTKNKYANTCSISEGRSEDHEELRYFSLNTNAPISGPIAVPLFFSKT